MIGTILLRTVPELLRHGVDSGAYKVYGSVVRSTSTGRIVGHLQETGLLGRLPLPGLSVAGDIANSGLNMVQIAQNEQIKAALSVLQSMQVADLALGAAGIGVTAIGSAILFRKIGRVEAAVAAMSDRLDRIARHAEGARADLLGDLLARLHAAAEQLEEGWQLADPVTQWRQVALEAHTLASIFERRLIACAGMDDLGSRMMDPLLDAMALAGATRVTARLACNDIEAACDAATRQAEALVRAGAGLALPSLLLASYGDSDHEALSDGWRSAMEEGGNTHRRAVDAKRRREAGAVSTALTIAEIRERGIVGREWLEAARGETEQPLLFLPARDEATQ